MFSGQHEKTGQLHSEEYNTVMHGSVQDATQSGCSGKATSYMASFTWCHHNSPYIIQTFVVHLCNCVIVNLSESHALYQHY